MTVSAAVFSTPCPLAQARRVGKLESWKVEESSVLALQLFNSSTFQLVKGSREAREAAGHLVQRGVLLGIGEPDVATSIPRLMEETAAGDGGHTDLFHQELRERHVILGELADLRHDVVGTGRDDGPEPGLAQDLQHAIPLALVECRQLDI